MNEQLRALISDTLGISAQAVNSALRREDEDSWDSLNHLRLVTAIEQAFGVRFSMDDIQSANSVGDLVKVLEREGVAQ